MAGGSAQVQNMPIWEGGRLGSGGEGIACGRVRKGEGLREIFNREKHIKTEDRFLAFLHALWNCHFSKQEHFLRNLTSSLKYIYHAHSKFLDQKSRQTEV